MANAGAPDQSILDIMQNLRNSKSMQFVDKNILLKDCRMKGIQEPDVEKGLEKLLNDGLIYSTMNDNVFALTE